MKTKNAILLSFLLFAFAMGYLTTPSAVSADRSDIEAFVTRFYREVLGREPDTAGLNGWVDSLVRRTLTGADLAYQFVLSPEFKNRGVSDESYLNTLYIAFFDRQPDPIGFNGWLASLKRGNLRELVLNGFIQSREFLNLSRRFGIQPAAPAAERFVARLYALVLDRPADADGLRNWTDSIRTGTLTSEEVVQGFVFSQEFVDRNTSVEEYVRILYAALFDREPDSAGFDEWARQLRAGVARKLILDNFTGSQEFDALIATFVPQPGSITGVLSVGEGQKLDGDTSDPSNPRIDNNTVGQSIPVPVTVGGYASQLTDAVDIYRVSIQSPITISLGIAEPDSGDLDLSFETENGVPLKQSLGSGAFEMIETNPDQIGDFHIVVRAKTGSSNYILTIGVVSASPSSLSALVRENGVLFSNADFIADEIILQPRTDTSDRQTQSMLASMSVYFGMVPKVSSPSGAVLMKLEHVDQSAFMSRRSAVQKQLTSRFPTDDARKRAQTLEIIKILRNNAAVEYAEPNYIYRINAFPNDALYGFQWHYPLINLPQAWNVTTGSDDVVVAVIDTGVATTHPDLAGRILRTASGAVIGYDFISDPANANDGDGIDPNPFDSGDFAFGSRSSFHGTHVAGTVGAATNNSSGVAAVTWRGKIMPLRALGVLGGTTFDIAQAIRYAAGVSNASGKFPAVVADVINMSLGPINEFCETQPPVGQTLADAVNAALNAGINVVVAAGNDNCGIPVPLSTIDGVISVSAVDIDRQKSFYSNFGTTVDVAGPGGDTSQDKNGDGADDGVISTLADDSQPPLQFIYAAYQGTSMATPHVAGVIALMRSVNPTLTPLDVNRLLSGTHHDPNAGPITTDLGAPGRDDVFGYGLIDAFQAVNVARNIAGGGGGTPPPADTPVLAVTPDRLNFSVTTTDLQLIASNPGTARMEITAITDDASWLAVETPALPFGIDPGSATPFILTATVNRNGLANGSYLGNINILSNAGDRTVTVAMQVRPIGGGDLGTVYVLILDPETFDPLVQTETNIADGYGYQTPVVAPGRYIVAAGTDRDNDGYICESGEACGIFPLADSPAELVVDGDLFSVDFPVAYDFFASNAAAVTLGLPPRAFDGFRLPDP